MPAGALVFWANSTLMRVASESAEKKLRQQRWQLHTRPTVVRLKNCPNK